MQTSISISMLTERVFTLHQLSHAQVATQTKKGAFDLCKSFLSQIAQLLKEKQSKEVAMGMQKLCSPNPSITNELIIQSNKLLFDAILLAKLFDKFAGGFDLPTKQIDNDSQTVRIRKGNFFLPINQAEVEFLHFAEAAQFDPSVLIEDTDFLQAFCSSEITKFIAPEKAAKSPNFKIYSITTDNSKESINFAYNARENRILGVTELGYKAATNYLF